MRYGHQGFALLSLLLLSCTDPNAGSKGMVVLRANGGNEAREGIEASRFADGFAVEYDHAILSISDFHLRTSEGDDANVEMPPRVVDLVPSVVDVFETDEVAAQRWDEVGFKSHPPMSGVLNINAPQALVDQMVDGGYSFLQTGRLISLDGDVIPFELGFPISIDYFTCTSGDGTFGIVVPVQGTAQSEITWHLTHLWFDSFAEDSAFRAEAIAAMYDGKHPVRTEDLVAQPLSSLKNREGEPLRDERGNPVIYIPPQEPGVSTLRDFVVRARFAHFNGLGGSCNTEIRVAPGVQ